MPPVIERDIRLIVVKKVKLDCVIARTIKEVLIHRVGIRADSAGVSDAMRVLEHGHFFRQQTAKRLLRLGITLRPERLHRVECRGYNLHTLLTVLNDNALNSIWMSGGNPIAARRAVVLHVYAEAIQS